VRAGARDENDDLRLVSFEEPCRDRGFGGIGDLRLDGAGAAGQLGNSAAVRDTATVGAPASAKAVAIPWPSPRLAPTTIVVLLDRSVMVCSCSGCL
jgi:hypothetical protein